MNKRFTLASILGNPTPPKTEEPTPLSGSRCFLPSKRVLRTKMGQGKGTPLQGPQKPEKLEENGQNPFKGTLGETLGNRKRDHPLN